MKKFFNEFKTFITRGNVLDLAVGVIIGGAFTAIVTALTTNILTPIINWVIKLIFGSASDTPVYTVLVGAYLENGALDTANSIYIDWGAFIGAIINFLLVAFILFLIVRAINKVTEKKEKLANKINENKLTKEDKKALKEKGIKLSDAKSVKEYIAEKKAKEQVAIEEAKKAEEKKAQEERLANPTTEDLLKDIKALLEKSVK